MELFFDIETVLTVNWIVLTFYCVKQNLYLRLAELELFE